MKITIFSIFPELLNNFFNESLLGKAKSKNIWELKTVNIRDYATDRHGTVDDVPYGGGCGMVMKPDIISRAIDENCIIKETKFFYMSPKGRHINQKIIRENLINENIAILCGRYEGVDERIIEEYQMEELSLGDFVLMGGEVAAMAFVEAIIRCLPDVVGDSNSIIEDSFGGASGNEFDNLLEYPIYTRPEIWRNKKVPEILLSGHHKKISDWKLDMAKKITAEKRPDLIKID